MIKRSNSLLISILLSLFCSGSSWAFQAAVLKSADIKPYNEALEGFAETCDCEIDEFVLTEIGEHEVREKLLGVQPELMLAIGLDALTIVHAEAARTRRMPVVYAMVPQFPSFLLDDKNFSGVSMRISAERYVSAMLDIFPAARRVGVIYDPRNLEKFVAEAVEAAQARGITIVSKKANRPGDVISLIDGMKGQIDVFWMPPDITVVNSITVEHMLLFSFQNKIPIFTFSRKYVEMGALASVSVMPFDIGKQAGEMAKELITGKRKSPIRTDARKTVLTVNKKVASKLGVRIRDEILRKADVVN